jgi:hypothetical protein
MKGDRAWHARKKSKLNKIKITCSEAAVCSYVLRELDKKPICVILARLIAYSYTTRCASEIDM